MSTDPREGRTHLQALAAGSQPFDVFYRAQYRPLLRLAWSLTGRKDLGEELVQETMLKVHRRWDEVGRYDSPGGFARRVLLNDARTHAKRRDAERRALRRVEASTPRQADDPPPGDEFWSAVRALPPRQRQVVALHYVDDCSVADIASVLGIAQGTVKVHLHRGRSALADALDGRRDHD